MEHSRRPCLFAGYLIVSGHRMADAVIASAATAFAFAAAFAAPALAIAFMERWTALVEYLSRHWHQFACLR